MSFSAQATLGDVDGDGGVDVVLGGFTTGFSTRGWIHAWHADGAPVAGFPFQVPDGKAILNSSVTITDLDRDGDVDLLVGAVTGIGGTASGRVFAFDLAAPYDPSTMEWPTVGHDVRHTSRYEPPDRRPVADAGPDQHLECASPDGAEVTLDGSASYEPDEDDTIVAHAWFADFGLPTEVLLGTGAVLDVVLPVGVHELTLQVTDGPGARGTDTTLVTVRDTAAPSLAVAVDPAELWPPNHRMVEVAVTLAASDACDPAPGVRLVSVASSEADDAPGRGDGETQGDVSGADLGTPDGAVRLRAERSGSGPGRTYELRYEATDVAGNLTPALARVRVPHDQGDRPGEPELRVEQDPVTGTVRLLWPAVTDAVGYDVIRGERSQVTLGASAVHLGTVTVLARGIEATALQPGDDDPLPPAGEAAFYLLQSRTETGGGGYGLESVPWPRVPASCGGGCP